MAKKKVTKMSKTRFVVFGSICLIIITCFIINTSAMLLNIKNLSVEQQSLQNDLTKLQEEETNLNKELLKLKNDEYKAKYARENFLYSKKDGEYIFASILDEDENEVTETKVVSNPYHYVIAAVIILLLLIILFILKRIRKLNKKV